MKRGDLPLVNGPVQKVEYPRLYDIKEMDVARFLFHFLSWDLEHGLDGFQLLNGDEVGAGGPKTANSAPGNALQLKGSTRPHVYGVGRNTGRVSLMLWTAASGYMPPPWVLLSQSSSDEHLNHALVQTGTVPIYDTPRGYMTAEVFEANLPGFISHYRKTYLAARGFVNWQTMPLLILLDGASSHKLTPQALASPALANVDILYLPAHSSHVFQTVDVAIARMVKKDLNVGMMARVDWQGQEETMKSRPVADILFQLEPGLKEASTYVAGVSAWKSTGLFPWNPVQLDNRDQLPEGCRKMIRSLVRRTKEECLDVLAGHMLKLSEENPEASLEGGTSGAFMVGSASRGKETARSTGVAGRKGKAAKK